VNEKAKQFVFPITTVVSAITVAFTVGAFGFYVTSVESDASVSAAMADYERRIARLERQSEQLHDALEYTTRLSAETVADLRNHIKRGDEYIQRYDAAVDVAVENRNRIIALESIPEKRPDPFTGTQGRALEERIQQLEKAQ